MPCTSQQMPCTSLSKPALKFISNQRYQSILWKDEIIKSMEEAISLYRDDVTAVIRLMLPNLADGWFRQRGNVFGFGDFDPSSPQLLSATSEGLLNEAPVSNIPAEQQVGFINYEVGIRGENQLRCASAANVKCKSYDLVELQPAETYKAFQQPAEKVNDLIKQWKEDQAILMEQNLTRKKQKTCRLIRGKIWT